ncbi:hypothetical protein F511_44033 [Dorcoceras hygrometricum]|uniref:Uncharacterized protein n=1 Tax=Dorcoceras hygrometricum TaxID=472368 RepID=A0A2Z7D6S8_9LAMI|nr:hypothetical protein F511_44033 [Dorcoceras hygrometricum]
MDQLVCFWKFGPQCPTSPLIPPRKAPLEDFDGYSAKAKRCRINLFKRHRFAIANFEYARLVALKLATVLPLVQYVPAGCPRSLVYQPIHHPLRCSSWSTFHFSACSWFLSFQLIHFAPAGSTWPPPDYEQLT